MIASFVRGLSVRDVEAALADALGEQAAVSKSTVSSICQQITEEYQAWARRRLDEVRLDYLETVATVPRGGVRDRRRRQRGRPVLRRGRARRRRRHPRPVYAHIDLDVLEPTEFGSIGYREPDGVSPQRLIDLVSRLDNVVGAAITEHMPTGDAGDAHDAEVIRRLGAALRL